LGVGQAFNVDDKAFVEGLYSIMPRLALQKHSVQDFLAYIKCCAIVILQKKQFSNEIVLAFIKRLCVYASFMEKHEQVSVLLLVKLAFSKYPICKSLLDLDEDSLPMNSAAYKLAYNADINDPALAGASATTIIFELTLLSHQKAPG